MKQRCAARITGAHAGHTQAEINTARGEKLNKQKQRRQCDRDVCAQACVVLWYMLEMDRRG